MVDPYFVYALQVLGMHLCEHLDYSPPMARLQARYAQRAWECLLEVYRGDNERLKAQGFIFFAYSRFFMGFNGITQFFLWKLCKIIDDANLRFLPVYGRAPELSDQVREDITVLSQTIYLGNYFYLTLGGSEPTMMARLEREFRLDLEVRIIQRLLL